MQVTEFNDVKVYNLSAGKSLPQFLEEAAKKNISLRKSEEFKHRLDLIQDFEFTGTSGRVKVSPDGEFIVATGVYPPSMRLYEVRTLSMKHERGLDSEVLDLLWLSDDYKKLVFLEEDRNLEFHAQYGRHHKMRVPKACRCLAYDWETTMLFAAGSASEVFRVDLEGGTFVAPLASSRLKEVEAMAVSPTLPILSVGGSGGIVESFDTRHGTKPLRSLQVVAANDSEVEESVTAISYSQNGMQFAAGTSTGLVRVYDVRSSKALSERDHMNGFPIKSVTFHSRGLESQELLVASADTRAVKVWNANSGALTATVESKSAINNLEWVPGTGLFFCANDDQRIGCYFVPALGLAPNWCSFLDGMTEELEESRQQVVFDDYKFVTADDLEQLGAMELVGTKFLQPYMHGYFMDHRLHAKLKMAMNPFAFDEYRKSRIQQKMDAKRTMRTRVKSKVNVNKALHEELQFRVDGSTQEVSKKRKQEGDHAQSILTDKRFGDLFLDPDFAIESKEEREREAKKLMSSVDAAMSMRTPKIRAPGGRKRAKTG